MNPDFPPLRFADPLIRTRRREKSRPVPKSIYTQEQRSAIARRAISEIRKVDAMVKKLSPEQKRAVFLKITHDRRLTLEDLRGTKLKFMGEPGDRESLVVPKAGAFEAIEQRMHGIEEVGLTGAPKGISFADAVREITVADPKERLSEDLLAQFEEISSKSHFVYEMELSSFASHPATRRKEISATIEAIKTELGNGIQGAICDTDFEDSGARILLWSTGAKFRDFVENCQWHRRITFFDRRPNIKTFSETIQNFNAGNVSFSPPPKDAPTICVIDSGVAAGNPFLKPVLKREASRSWVHGLSPLEDPYGHGSGVASLSAYHSLSIADGEENKATAWVASARIMTDEGELDSPRLDCSDEDRRVQAKLLSTILREIVEHFAPIGVKIFVLSFEIQGHVWSLADRRHVARNAWVARTVDTLSREFDIVFCCITGNLAPVHIQELVPVARYPYYLTAPLSKLLDPGPAALAITAGSIAHSTRVIGGNHTPIAERGMPSPFTRTGPGFGESIKPDVVEYGGNLVTDNVTAAVSANGGTNVVMASNRVTPALAHLNGTSFSAPRVANHLAIIQRDANALGIPSTNPLLRAFLAATALPVAKIRGVDKASHLSMTGFGLPDGRRALLCEGHSAILYWHGTMLANQSALFRIHVPAEMATVGRTLKRITVAVAASPPVQSWGIADYLGAKLKFWLFRGDCDFSKVEQQMQRDADEKNEAFKDAVEHMNNCRLKINARSTGTLQCDIFQWVDHKTDYSADDYTLAVNLGKPAAWLKGIESIPIAVIVRVEETSGRLNELYAKIRASIQARARIRA
ncbi:MAG: S8 family peptidase [Akkermansiaceae bacterium]|jgi:hypothetical protein|nr:S8 family peptidase [Akkermansiaceae bacterium]